MFPAFERKLTSALACLSEARVAVNTTNGSYRMIFAKTRLNLLGLAVLGTLSLSLEQAASAATYNPKPALQQIHSLYNPTATDQLLTQTAAEASWLLSIGWGSTTSDVIYLERQPQSTTLPLRRFYKGLPQSEHFYTTGGAPAGWIDEGIVGHIYVEQVPGSTPLYQLVRPITKSGDMVHRYTLSTSVRSTLLSQGFQDEGVTGYVYSSAFPTVGGGHVFGARLGCNGTDYRDCSFGSYVSVNSIGTKPSWATQQVMTFQFWTPDMFATTSNPASASGEHLVFVPRSVAWFNPSNLFTSSLHGIGLALGFNDTAGCTVGDTTFVEEWWPVSAPPTQPNWNSYNFTLSTPPNSCGGGSLMNRTWYDVTVSVSNSGVATYTVKQGATLVLSGSAQYGTSPYVEAAFPATATGYFLTNAQSAQRDYTAYVTNLSVTWSGLPPSGCSVCPQGQDCRCGYCWPTNLLCQ